MRRLGISVQLAWLIPAPALAQDKLPVLTSRLWIVAGAASGTVRGDCQDCEQDFPFHHAAAVVGNAGYRVSPRLDVGADLFWMKWRNDSGEIRATAIDAVAQFRPWGSKGFFAKGGAGMSFIRNWVRTIGPNPDVSKALAVLSGGGWEFDLKGVSACSSLRAARQRTRRPADGRWRSCRRHRQLLVGRRGHRHPMTMFSPGLPARVSMTAEHRLSHARPVHPGR